MATAEVYRHRGLLGPRTTLAAAMAAGLLLLLGPTAYAATITVNSLQDTGAPGICVLRDAVTAANAMTATNGCAAGTGDDTIQFSVAGTILLSSSLPTITDSNLTIIGPPSPGITLDGGNMVQVMQVSPGATVKVDRMKIANGFDNATDVSQGGAGIRNEGTLTVSNSTFSGNRAISYGGGIANEAATLTVSNSTFFGNSSRGGGAILSLRGTLTVNNSTFSDDSSEEFGGAIYCANYDAGTLTVSNSTFSGNTAPRAGGGIFNDFRATVSNSTFSDNSALDGGGILNYNTMGVTNSTFSGNRAPVRGGGISSENLDGREVTLRVTNSTFSGNSADLTGGNGIYNQAGHIASIKSTILASSVSGNCSGTMTDDGYNISNDSSCGFSATGSHNNTNPMLDPAGLANNGGPTQTIALLEGSPAIDAIPLDSCTDPAGNRLATDQRGLPRPDAGEHVCDIGAYEFQDAPVFAGQPGKPNCHGKSVSALAKEFGGLDAAASALGFPSVQALQNAIWAFCSG
jgi:predicted outer membrane repeat protein